MADYEDAKLVMRARRLLEKLEFERKVNEMAVGEEKFLPPVDPEAIERVGEYFSFFGRSLLGAIAEWISYAALRFVRLLFTSSHGVSVMNVFVTFVRFLLLANHDVCGV